LKIMHTLLKSGHTVGLATNINSELLELLVMRDALLSKLVICCSADIRAVKPSQRFYEHASKLTAQITLYSWTTDPSTLKPRMRTGGMHFSQTAIG